MFFTASSSFHSTLALVYLLRLLFVILNYNSSLPCAKRSIHSRSGSIRCCALGNFRIMRKLTSQDFSIVYWRTNCAIINFPCYFVALLYIYIYIFFFRAVYCSSTFCAAVRLLCQWLPPARRCRHFLVLSLQPPLSSFGRVFWLYLCCLWQQDF